MLPIVIPSGAGRFFPRFAFAKRRPAQSRNLSSAFVAQACLRKQALACVPFNVATLYPFTENLPVEVLSSKGTIN
jgi:hypothetical protein